MKFYEALHIVNEDVVSRLLNIHEKTGYIIITAQSEKHTAEQNISMQKKLLKEIKDSGFSYKTKGISGGSLEDDGTYKDGSKKFKKIDGEKSIIVFCKKTDGTNGDINELKKLGIKWAKDYDQHSFYFKHPNNQPLWIGADGIPRNSFQRKIKINSDLETFYTNLNGGKTGNTPIKGKMPKADKRFATTMNKQNYNGKWKEPSF